ncbi:hypothetical protein [Maritalea porphyrae]|uniref:hypothetical protein n=1 Tax=Maritalea porphyrae TaxID=880732 RepID=UPI0022B075CF|nr:hypothetical protein [Maritalea porphyrae]MCZ4274016.1 hypothetical protein [Maritalea porphyrae]
MAFSTFVRQTKPNPRDVLCKLHLAPSGDHRIRLHLDGSPLEFDMSEQEARKALGLLNNALAEIHADDGRPTERTNPTTRAVE